MKYLILILIIISIGYNCYAVQMRYVYDKPKKNAVKMSDIKGKIFYVSKDILLNDNDIRDAELTYIADVPQLLINFKKTALIKLKTITKQPQVAIGIIEHDKILIVIWTANQVTSPSITISDEIPVKEIKLLVIIINSSIKQNYLKESSLKN